MGSYRMGPQVMGFHLNRLTSPTAGGIAAGFPLSLSWPKGDVIPLAFLGELLLEARAFSDARCWRFLATVVFRLVSLQPEGPPSEVIPLHRRDWFRRTESRATRFAASVTARSPGA